MSIFQTYQGSHLVPGSLPTVETLEAQYTSIVWGRYEQQTIGHNVIIDAASQDTGNVGYETTLRPGLLLGTVISSGKTVPWDPSAVDGSQNISGILLLAVPMGYLGSTKDRFTGYVLQAGNIKAKGLLIPGNANAGISGDALEFEIRKQIFGRFKIDDDALGYGFESGYRGIVPKTANYTVVYADYGKMFTNAGAAGAVTFTLPATPRKGLKFAFRVEADQTVTVTSPSANVIAFNNVAATSLAFSTASQKVGGMLTYEGNGTKWVVRPAVYSGQAVTVS